MQIEKKIVTHKSKMCFIIICSTSAVRCIREFSYYNFLETQ